MTLRRTFGFVTAVAVVGAALACGEVLSSNPDQSDTAATDAAAFDVGVADGPSSSSSGADAPPACTDTSTDPKNCGACGHDCLGGACNAGKCQPVLLATTTDPQVPWLTVDSTRVLWLTSPPFLGGFGALYSCPKQGCGGTPTTLKSNFKGGALGSDGTTAYFSDVQFGTVWRVGSGGPEALSNLGKGGVLWISPRAGALFVTAYYEADASPFSRSFHRGDLASGGYQLVAPFDSPTHNTDNNAYTKTHIYLGSHNTSFIAAAPIAGGSFTSVLTSVEAAVGSMTSDGDRVYFTGPGGGSVHSCLGDGNACNVRLDLAVPNSKFLGAPIVVLAADGLLFMETTMGDLLTCATNDCAGTVKVLVHETELATDWHYSGYNIAVDAQSVYYVTRDETDASPSFAVKRIARDPK